MKLFVLLSLLSLQTATALAGASPDEDAANLVSFNNILTRLEENAPSTLFSLSNRFRDGIFTRDGHLKEKRQEEGGSNLTSPSNSGPSAVPTVSIPTAKTTSNTEPTNNPSPTETETETETGTGTGTGTDTDTGSETSSTDSPTDTTPDQPTLTSSTSKKDPTTSNFQTQTRTSSSSSSTSSTSSSSTASEITTESKITTSDAKSTHALTSRTSLSTTTLPDGTKSTITAVTVVNPTAEVTEGGDPTETRGAPGLQTGAAAGSMVSNNEFLALFGGAAVFALAF